MKKFISEQGHTIKIVTIFVLIAGFIITAGIALNKRNNAPLKNVTISTFEKNEKIEGTVIASKRKTKRTHLSLVKTNDGRYYLAEKYLTKGRNVKIKTKECVVMHGETEYETTFATRTSLKNLDKFNELAKSKKSTSNDFKLSSLQLIFTK